MTETFAGVGSSRAISTAGGGRTYSFNNLGVIPIQIVGINPQRQSITIHNPGTVNIFVAPLYVQNTGSDVLLSPTPALLGGCWQVNANGGTLMLTGEVQKPYQAFAASGVNNPLTVTDSNI